MQSFFFDHWNLKKRNPTLRIRRVFDHFQVPGESQSREGGGKGNLNYHGWGGEFEAKATSFTFLLVWRNARGGNIAFVVFSKMCNQVPNRVYQKFEQGHLIVKFGARDRAFEQVYGPVGRGFEQANFQKFKCLGCRTANLLRGTEVYFPTGAATNAALQV